MVLSFLVSFAQSDGPKCLMECFPFVTVFVKVSVILIVVVESTYLHCKEVCEYILIHRITFIPKSS